VKEIHAEAGFELCQFSSSSPIVEAASGTPGQVKSVGWGEAEQKILGMRWQLATDDFRFNVEYHRVPSSVLSGDRVPTKREYLSLLVGRRYQTGLLWKDDYAVLPRSYEMAHRRLINVGQLALEYDRIIKDMRGSCSRMRSR